jgi:hypothetical protein
MIKDHRQSKNQINHSLDQQGEIDTEVMLIIIQVMIAACITALDFT